MKQIIKDFYKYHFTSTLGYILSTICIVGGMLLAGVYINDDIAWLGIAVTVFFTAQLAYQCIRVYIIAPADLNKQADLLTHEQTEELFSEYPVAKKAEHHRYMSSMVLFYRNRRIYLISYKDISGITAKGKNLLLYLHKKEKPVLMPCANEGLCAIAFAYMRDKNPDIKKLAATK